MWRTCRKVGAVLRVMALPGWECMNHSTATAAQKPLPSPFPDFIYGDAPVIGEGGQHLLLFVPQPHVQYVMGEGDGRQQRGANAPLHVIAPLGVMWLLRLLVALPRPDHGLPEDEGAAAV